VHQKIVVIHIPKTAGSSLRRQLAWSMGAIHAGKHRILGGDKPVSGDGHFDGLRQKAEQMLPGLLNDGMQVMSGHYRYRDITPVLAPLRDQVTLVTFVRDPIWRTVSDYFYCISQTHTSQAEFLANYPTFDSYLSTPGEMNKQLDYLRPHPEASVAETIDSALENLDFIGMTENFNADFLALMQATGLPSKLQDPWNVNPNRDEITAAYETFQDRMRDILAPDVAFHEAIVARRRLPE